MGNRGGGALTAVAVVLSVMVVCLGAGLLYLVLSGGSPDLEDVLGIEEQLKPKSFEEYTWEELSEVAKIVSQAPTSEDAKQVAAEYGIEVGSVRTLPLDDGRSASLTVVGIYADERADSSGMAGLTLMASPISLQPMNQSDTNEGGWEASWLRSWLDGEGLELLPDELADGVVAVSKLTNNVGVTSDEGSVTSTSDRLWLFSASEVCGAPGWFVDEYGEEPNAYTGYVDFTAYDKILSLEGDQYEFFASSGVSGTSDPNGALSLTYGGSQVAWWYRTAYPYTFTGDDASFFFQVMASGYPSTTGLASQAAGVTVGLCL